MKKKARRQRASLKTFLQSVYQDSVNMETTCNHRCECCSVSMPQMNYCEFVQIISDVWKKNKTSDEEKLNLICKSLEYFMRFDYNKWGMQSLIKPCLFLDNNTKLCKIYKNRPLNCRIYGLWPDDVYKKRVDKFEEVYKKYGLKREDLPLHSQCPYVKRVDTKNKITEEVLDSLFKELDKMDKVIGDFSDLQIEQRENYRTFHDWLLLKVFGEEWLEKLTTFAMAASKEVMEAQIKAITEVLKDKFTKGEISNVIGDI